MPGRWVSIPAAREGAGENCRLGEHLPARGTVVREEPDREVGMRVWERHATSPGQRARPSVSARRPCHTSAGLWPSPAGGSSCQPRIWCSGPQQPNARPPCSGGHTADAACFTCPYRRRQVNMPSGAQGEGQIPRPFGGRTHLGPVIAAESGGQVRMGEEGSGCDLRESFRFLSGLGCRFHVFPVLHSVWSLKGTMFVRSMRGSPLHARGCGYFGVQSRIERGARGGL